VFDPQKRHQVSSFAFPFVSSISGRFGNELVISLLKISLPVFVKFARYNHALFDSRQLSSGIPLRVHS
jgi:hypothetical protein